MEKCYINDGNRAHALDARSSQVFPACDDPCKIGIVSVASLNDQHRSHGSCHGRVSGNHMFEDHRSSDKVSDFFDGCLQTLV